MIVVVLFIVLLMIFAIVYLYKYVYLKHGEHFLQMQEFDKSCGCIVMTFATSIKDESSLNNFIKVLESICKNHSEDEMKQVGIVLIVNEFDLNALHTHAQQAIKKTFLNDLQIIHFIQKEDWQFGQSKSLNIIFDKISTHYAKQYWIHWDNTICVRSFIHQCLNFMNTNRYISQLEIKNECNAINTYKLVPNSPFSLEPSINRFEFYIKTGLFREGFKTDVSEFGVRWIERGGIKGVVNWRPLEGS